MEKHHSYCYCCCCLGRIWLHHVHPALFDRFQRTTIDLSLPWRFANLPNNAKLEIVTRTRKQAVTESQVSSPLVTQLRVRHFV